MRKRVLHYIFLCVALLLAGCTDTDIDSTPAYADARELSGIEAIIEGGAGVTRAGGTVTPLADYVGRSKFKENDEVVFTNIRRSTAPIVNFIYPDLAHTYDGIYFKAGNEGGWKREIHDATHEPERIYWTDATNDHTFIAFSTPQVIGFDWKTYQFEQEENSQTVRKTFYIGSLGNPTLTGENDIIDYYIDPYEKDGEGKYKYRSLENGDSVFTNPTLENEDLLIAYDENMQAEPGGSVALVKFYHALSSVRVVVNISGFSSSSTAADNDTKVSNMRLLHQPTMYIWEQSKWGAEPMRATKRDGAPHTDQDMINSAWGGTGPAFDQRKDIRLWIPHPEGVGTNQRKTFTFYGITTPQPDSYITTLPAGSDYRKAVLKFTVTYPNPMKPSETVDRTYEASLEDVYFEAGYNTTINISLNHRNEKMTVGAEYENWQFVATPDQGQLKKNSTFLQQTNRLDDSSNPIVTIVGDAKATADDATWLYEGADNNIYDIYGHRGDSEVDAYQISTANQLLSFAYEVKNNNLFTGKYVRLDADIIMQKEADLTKEETSQYVFEDNSQKANSAYDEAASSLSWIGIGDADHAFNGTFIGGKRFIHRLYGSPLFYSLGSYAKIEHLQVSAVSMVNGGSAVDGNGLFANTNAGLICACKVVGDVSLNGSTAGAFVGENTSTGRLWCCYQIGITKSTSTEETVLVGGLVGSNSGIIASCYHAGNVTAKSGSTIGGITASNSGTLDNNYYNSTLLTTPTYNPGAGVTGVTTTDMTKQAFVNNINTGITTWVNDPWVNDHTGYDNHSYIYQPANYPKLE